MTRTWFAALVCLAALAALNSCAHLPTDATPATPSYTPLPSPSAPTITPSPGTTPSPGPTSSGQCGSQASNATILVAMALSIAPTTDPTYGTISGYTEADLSTGTFGNVATVIKATTSDVIQFANAEAGTVPINHSAVGFPHATTFPGTPYSFPTSTQQAIGTQITQTQWSSGIVPEGVSYACFSPPFTLPTPGTYFFGDYNYYNLSNMRDVIVVTQ